MIVDGTLPATLACLAAIPDPGRRLAAFTGAIIERGGTILLPSDTGHWGPLLVEFHFLGVLGTGETPEEALSDWMKCATRMVEAERTLHDTTAPLADLRDACRLVRIRSQNPAAIEKGRRLQQALDMGMQ